MKITDDEIEKRQHDLQEKAIRDYNSAMKASREEGYTVLLQRMVNNGISIANISKMVDMTEEEIREYIHI